MIQISAKATLKLPAFDLTDKAKIALAKLLRDMLKKQAKDGVLVNRPSGDNSRVMPKGKHDGRRIDLVETGALWSEVQLLPLKVVFTVPYASFVIEKYAAGLSPRYKEIFDEKAKPIVAKGLIVKGSQT